MSEMTAPIETPQLLLEHHLKTLRLLAELLLVECSLVVHLLLCRRERFWVGPGAGFGWILVVNHIGLRIVLLFCTHGINLGRT